MKLSSEQGASTAPILSSSKPTSVRYAVLGWICVAAAISYIPRNSISVAAGEIQSELRLDKDQMGTVMSAFFLSYALLQLPSGWFSQRFGSRRTMSLYAAFWSMMSIAFACAGNFWMLILSRLGMGVAQAGLFPASTNSISHWFPQKRRGFASGALGGFMSLGGALATWSCGFLLPFLGWRYTYIFFCLPGLLWAVGFYWWFRDRPSDHPAVNDAERESILPQSTERIAATSLPDHPAAEENAEDPAEEVVVPWGAILLSPATWWICAQQFFRAAGYTFFASWFATFLKEGRGVATPEMRGLLNAIPVLFVFPGSLLGGMFSDWLFSRTSSISVSRRGLSIVTLLISSALIFSTYYIQNAIVTVALISIGSFISATAGSCAYAITIDMGKKHVAPVFALMNMSGNLGALVFPKAVPWILDRFGWDGVVLFFGLIYLAAAVCWGFLQTKTSLLEQTWFPRRDRGF